MAKLDADREGMKKSTGGAIGLFFAISLYIMDSTNRVGGFGRPLILIVIGAIGLFSCIWWLRQYGGDVDAPGTPSYGGMSGGIVLLTFIWVGITVFGILAAFR